MCLNRLNAALDEWHSETGLKWRSIGMKRLTKIMTATMFACSIPTFAAAASFNCAKASTANEIAICSDDELSTLDEALAAIYKQARSSVSDAKRLKTEQVNWIKSLGTCNGNVDCLISAYDTRILILDYLDGTIAVKSDSLQDRISQLNEQEEILVLRENALTTELRALNLEIERFEEEKLAFAKLKDAPIVAEELSSEKQESTQTQSCQYAAIDGEELSLSKCAGFLIKSAETFNRKPFFPDGIPTFFWEVDQSCKYLPSLLDNTQENHLEFGKASLSVKLLAGNVDAMTSIVNACMALIKNHSQ